MESFVPNTVQSRIRNPVQDASYSHIFQHLDISPFPRQTRPVDSGSAENPPRVPLSHNPILASTRHPIPHSLAALKKSETPFWLLDAISLGSRLRDRLYSIIRGWR